MGGSVNNQAAAPNFRNIQAPVDPGIMQFAKQEFAGDSMAGRDAYQAELINQLRANSYQNPEAVWGSVRDGRQQAQQAQQSQQMQELNNFIATAPQQPIQDPTGRLSQEEMQGSVWVPDAGNWGGGESDGGPVGYSTPITIEQLRAAGKKPEGQGQWQQYVFSQGGDAGGSYYAPYADNSSSWASGDGG